MFEALARLADRRARSVMIAAGVFFVVAGVIGSGAVHVLKPFGFDDPAAEAIRAQDKLEAASGIRPGPGVIALVRPGVPVRSSAGRREVAEVVRIIRADSSIAAVTPPGRNQVSFDGHAAYVVASFRGGLSDKQRMNDAAALAKRLASRPGVEVGGSGMVLKQYDTSVAADLRRAEIVAFPVLAILAFLIFRSVVASMLPLLVGGLSVVGAFLGLRLVAEATDLSVFAVNLISALGLGLAIDYSLFVVSRYREEIARTGPGYEAMRRTMATSGRTVVFSSITVAAALASLLIFPQRFLYSMGVGGVLVVLLSAVAAVVVLPALLTILGTRVNALAPRRFQRAVDHASRASQSSRWWRLSNWVGRRPALVAVVASAFLLALGIPFLGIKFTVSDASALPRSESAYRVDREIKASFPAGQTSPMFLAIDGAGPRQVAAYRARLAHLRGVNEVAPPVPLAHGVTHTDVFTAAPKFSAAAKNLVHEIRALHPPFSVLVGGETAQFLDNQASLGAHIPRAIAIIVAVTLVVLFLMTGSVILPFKQLLMSLLSLSAAFGLLVVIFQDGRFQGLLGYSSQHAIDNAQPMLLFAVAFGISTDYGVFLLARIKEAHDSGASNRDSIAIGLERSGRIVTAAALLFCVAVLSNVTSRIVFVKLVGIGVAAAVVIDATVIRAFLVPSLMHLLGRLNWWAPAPLRRLHARFHLSEPAGSTGLPAQPTQGVAAAPTPK